MTYLSRSRRAELQQLSLELSHVSYTESLRMGFRYTIPKLATRKSHVQRSVQEVITTTARSHHVILDPLAHSQLATLRPGHELDNPPTILCFPNPNGSPLWVDDYFPSIMLKTQAGSYKPGAPRLSCHPASPAACRTTPTVREYWEFAISVFARQLSRRHSLVSKVFARGPALDAGHRAHTWCGDETCCWTARNWYHFCGDITLMRT